MTEEQTMSINAEFVTNGDEQNDELNIEQLEDVAGGFWPAVAAGVASYVIWQGFKFAGEAGSSAGRGDRRR
jgi:lactobin A/cerein 7B family class IIb bacteriocin